MTLRTALVLACVAVIAGCSGMLAPPWGVEEGKLRPCGTLRGCVSSQAVEPERRVEPIAYQTSREAARDDLVSVIRSFRDAQVVSSHPNYLRVEFTSRDPAASGFNVLMIDIAEFYFPVELAQIEVRSIPRRNMPDSGDNRSRIEAIRDRFEELQRHHPILK
ncbi:MAG: DUF1499 domain-containing protein [Gammaproteobacteria bacterium]